MLLSWRKEHHGFSIWWFFLSLHRCSVERQSNGSFFKKASFRLSVLVKPRQFTNICTDNEKQAYLFALCNCQYGGACSSVSYKWGSLGPTKRMLSKFGSTFFVCGSLGTWRFWRMTYDVWLLMCDLWRETCDVRNMLMLRHPDSKRAVSPTYVNPGWTKWALGLSEHKVLTNL